MEQISPETRAFLSAVEAEGGSASTRQIRNRTQLTEGKLQYQFRKLSDVEIGLISIEYREKGSNSNAPIKVAHLTEAARDAIENGLLDNYGRSHPVEVDVVNLAERVTSLEAKVAGLIEQIGSQGTEPGVGKEKRDAEDDSRERTAEEEEEGMRFARRWGLVPDEPTDGIHE